jgi:hypothetical protein
MRRTVVPLVFAIGYLSACGRDVAEDGKTALRDAARTFMPSDASNVREATEVPWIQLSGVVDRKGDAYALDRQHIERAKRENWTVCEPTSEQWTDYQDRSVEPPVKRSQRIFLFFQDEILVLAIGERIPGGGPSSPTQTSQQVTVVARRASGKDIEDTTLAYHLQCNGPKEVK